MTPSRTEVYQGESITLTITIVGNPTGITVTSTGGTINGSTITFNVPPGIYTVTVTVTFAGGITKVVSIPITVKAAYG